jgi:hypothetical protein
MPQYQGVALEDLQQLRILFGCFPTYRDSPLRPSFDRILQVGDASGIQSPLRCGWRVWRVWRHGSRGSAAQLGVGRSRDSGVCECCCHVAAYKPGV